MVGAPDGISPVFTFKTVGIPHHPRVSSWPLRALLEARALGVAVVCRRCMILSYFSSAASAISMECILCEES